MGEYARRLSDGTEIKIGTCEDMYYLRAEQRSLLEGIPHSVDPNGPCMVGARFRFPWPDEDNILPGEFDNYDRAIAIDAPADDVTHHTVQFTAQGYVVSLPCPESLPGLTLWPPNGPVIHRNGFPGRVQLTQQKLLADGRLVPVLRCGGCHAAWRLEDPADIEALAVAFRSEGDRRKRDSWIEGPDGREYVGGEFWHKIADRILAGAGIPKEVAA